MKTTLLRNTSMAFLLAAGLAFTSCKKETTETDTDTTTTETYENSTDPDDGDTVVTATDSITEANREDKTVGGGEQVP